MVWFENKSRITLASRVARARGLGKAYHGEDSNFSPLLIENERGCAARCILLERRVLNKHVNYPASATVRNVLTVLER